MTPLVRFAPSPTGYLHVGNVRTALVNWLFAHALGGRFLLRLDDTDAERSREGYAQAIAADLQWLGLGWDGFSRQSERLGHYKAAKEKLLASGRLYPCHETQEELDIRRKMLAGRGLPPIYDRAALHLTEAQKAEYAARGRKPHYRFRLDDKPIAWQDLIRGEVRFASGHISDPVLVREDGVPLYTLASVVDDGEMGITHILRGEDHVSNTAVQMQIFEALGFAPPVFGHLALLKTKEGELSKRIGGNDIRSLRETGFEPMTVNSLLAKIGTSDAVEPFADLAALAASFDLKKFGRAPANYDLADIERLNEKLLTQMSFSTFAARATVLGLPPLKEDFWLSVRGNIKKLDEVRDWWDVVERPPQKRDWQAGEREFLTQAASVLPPEPWGADIWNRWTEAVKQKTARKGKELFLPLRLAITGREHGPELKSLLLLLGYANTKTRLETL